MTQQDAEQYAAVWKFAAEIMLDKANEARHNNIESLGAASLAAYYLANSICEGYDRLAEALS